MEMSFLAMKKAISSFNQPVFHASLGGGFKYHVFSSLLVEDSHFDLIFFKWVGIETTS